MLGFLCHTDAIDLLGRVASSVNLTVLEQHTAGMNYMWNQLFSKFHSFWGNLHAVVDGEGIEKFREKIVSQLDPLLLQKSR